MVRFEGDEMLKSLHYRCVVVDRVGYCGDMDVHVMIPSAISARITADIVKRNSRVLSAMFVSFRWAAQELVVGQVREL